MCLRNTEILEWADMIYLLILACKNLVQLDQSVRYEGKGDINLHNNYVHALFISNLCIIILFKIVVNNCFLNSIIYTF